jgi:hypothetical protein
VRKVQAWWARHGGGPVSANTSAYCQERARLSEATLEALQQQLAQRLEANVPRERLWPGRRVQVVDGTTCSIPDTAPSQSAYPGPAARNPAAVSRC